MLKNTAGFIQKILLLVLFVAPFSSSANAQDWQFLDSISDKIDAAIDRLDDYLSDEEFYQNAVIDVMPIAKAFADGYLVGEMKTIIQNQAEVFFENKNKFATTWSSETTQVVAGKIIKTITDVALLKAVPGLLKDTGAPILGDMSGMLFMKNHVPYEIIANKELFAVPGQGYKFVSLGKKASGSWINFFRIMSLASTKNIIDAIGDGGLEAVVKHVKEKIKDPSDKDKDAKKELSAQVADHFKELGVYIGKKIVQSLVKKTLETFKRSILPHEQITGFYTIKDGTIYHVHYAADSAQMLEIEKTATLYGLGSFTPAQKMQMYIESGYFKIGSKVLKETSYKDAAVQTLRGSSLFVVDAVLEFYMDFASKQVASGAKYLCGTKVDWFVQSKENKLLARQMGFFLSIPTKLYYGAAGLVTGEISSLVSDTILAPIFIPVRSWLAAKILAKKTAPSKSIIAGTTKINGEFYFFEPTEKYFEALSKQALQAQKKSA